MRRNLDWRIKEIDRIHSLFITATQQEKTMPIDSVGKALEKEKSDLLINCGAIWQTYGHLLSKCTTIQ